MIDNKLSRSDALCPILRAFEAGVLQGSVLGPLLVIMYLNELSSITQKEMLFFADDTSLHAGYNIKLQVVERSLQHDLECIGRYGSDWIITFNASETSKHSFTHNSATNFPTLTFNSTPIPIKNTHIFVFQ